MRPWTVGIDVGATKTHALLLDGDGVVRAERRAPTETGPAGVVEGSVRLAKELLADADLAPAQLGGVGLALPGVVDPVAGTCRNAVNLAIEEPVALVPLVSAGLGGVPVRLENDLNAAVLGARHLLAGSTLASLVGFGLNSFVAFLLVRKFEMSLAQAGLFAGLLASLPGAISVVLGGRLADWFGERRPAGYAQVPGLCLLVAAPIYMFAITRGEVIPLLGLVFVAALFQYTYLGVTFGVFQNLFHSRMRATGSALLNGVYGLIGQGLGPLLVGWLSDRLAPSFGVADGLAYAMAITAAIYVWAAAHYLLAARHIGPDLARVRGGEA